MNKSELLANQIINYLAARRGFDDWWINIESELQEEIVIGISNILIDPVFLEFQEKISKLENELLALEICGVDNWDGYSEAMICADEWNSGNTDYEPYA
ncbi:MAG: hypothetical protein KDH96_04475 [Candidatus Riesia sp.]|nr:hypothetical protein [Candidatus Riesia sp.]